MDKIFLIGQKKFGCFAAIADRKSNKDYPYAAFHLFGGEIDEFFYMIQIEQVKWNIWMFRLQRYVVCEHWSVPVVVKPVFKQINSAKGAS
jgi:hypothetical protein